MRPPPPRPRSSWSSAAIGSPSGTARQKLSPYSADRLRDQLADGALAGGSGGGSSGIERLEQPRHDVAQQREAVVEPPQRRGPARRSRSTTARTSSAGTPASSQARSTAKPSIASTSQPLVPPTRALVPIGQTLRVGERGARGARAAARRARARAGTSDGIVRVAVDRLAAEHELGLGEAVPAGEADVQHAARAVLGERAGGRRRRLDRADAADERAVRRRVEAVELALRRGDHQHRETVAEPSGRPLRANFVTEVQQKSNAP